MNAVQNPASPIPAEILADMERVAHAAMGKTRDPEAMRQACERMDRMREQLRARHGLLNIGVPAIRELRDAG